MSDIRLFRFDNNCATELPGKAALVEKQLQVLIEARMVVFLGIRFLASGYDTGKTHKGVIDSLGLDENGCPVIIEYKRHTNENVMSQGLFYLDWLLDHRDEFWRLVLNKLGQEAADKIEWKNTRLICIASGFTRYDEHAVKLMPRNIELIRYKYFGNDLILFELVNSVSVVDASNIETSDAAKDGNNSNGKIEGKTHAEKVEDSSNEVVALLDELAGYIHSLGDDIQQKQLKHYVAFARIKNFVCASVSLSKQDPRVILWMKLDPGTIELQEGFTRDVRNIGHWGTGDLEVNVRNQADLEKTKILIERCYQEN